MTAARASLLYAAVSLIPALALAAVGPAITSVELDGELVCKAAITPTVTIHGGSAADSCKLRVIQNSLINTKPQSAMRSDEVSVSVTIPANTDKTFSVPTTWKWSCTNDEPIPYNYEVHLDQCKSAPAKPSLYVIQWRKITFAKATIH